ECELWLTRAFVHRKRGAVDACESALHHASRTAVRASSKRNLEFEWAELHRARGDFPRALAHYEAAAKHHWRWQGGSGLLNWGTLLQQLGRTDEARAAWTQCLEQDPQSLAAREAQRLLSSSSQEPEPAAP
ncbi:MAG: tetratricopeptide repeat protein, partial [Archangium sp.]